MKARITGMLVGTLIVILQLIFVAAMAEAAPAEVCPEEGKVESTVDGDLDDIVLDAGTLVCIKGGQDLVTVTADGESTLRELLGNDKNVSHYTVLEEPSPTTTTTTSIPTTTTTTVSPTTTVPETTTTTIEDETSSTSLPDNTTTTTPQEEDTTTTTTVETTTSTVPTAPSELPYTGASDLMAYTILGILLLSMGGLTLAAMRGKNDES